MMMMNRRKKVITTNFTTFQTNILIINIIITLTAIYILLFLYTGTIDITTPFYGGKSIKKEQKRTIIFLFLCKNRKKIIFVG